MFLQQLTTPQRGAFLNLAYQLIAADGEIHSAELSTLSAMAAQAALPPSWQLRRDQPRDALLSRFDSHQSRAVVIMELLGLAYADTEYADEEKAFIEEVAGALEIRPERLALMEGWVIRQLVLSEEGAKLLEAC